MRVFVPNEVRVVAFGGSVSVIGGGCSDDNGRCAVEEKVVFLSIGFTPRALFLLGTFDSL